MPNTNLIQFAIVVGSVTSRPTFDQLANSARAVALDVVICDILIAVIKSLIPYNHMAYLFYFYDCFSKMKISKNVWKWRNYRTLHPINLSDIFYCPYILWISFDKRIKSSVKNNNCRSFILFYLLLSLGNAVFLIHWFFSKQNSISL